MEMFVDGPWKLGLNSVDDATELPLGQYQWLVNGVNKGGLISTRPGRRAITPVFQRYGVAHGMKIFTPRDGVPVLVFGVNDVSNTAVSIIRYFKYPFTSFTDVQVPGISFSTQGKIEFEVAVIGVILNEDETITAIDPYPVLMISDGQTRTAFWDGTTARHLDPGNNETPVCSHMKWIGNRLWTMRGNKIRVSDLLNPLKFTEEDIVSEGGYFNLPSEGKGFGVTPDYRSLLSFTDYTTTAFQAGILNRASWATTQDFQKLIFSSIGCAAPRSIVNQYGMTWWYSHNGLMNLDSALQTYRSSQIKYQDEQMRRSRINFSDDVSKICAGTYENFLMLSVPSGDMRNYHTWVMDSNPIESAQSPAQWSAAWTGHRPTQWATGIINGKQRCFCISEDLVPGNSTTEQTDTIIWENFLQDRRDMGYNIDYTTTAKPIACSFETRLIPVSNGPDYGRIKYAEIDIEELVGTAQVDVYYCGRRGTYKKIASKAITATTGSITSSMTLPVTFTQYLPQKRTVKTFNESMLASDATPFVETQFTKNKDRFFSILIKWTGQISISELRLYVDRESEETVGASESNETSGRYIRVNGEGQILVTSPFVPPIENQESGFISTITPRWVEDVYKSLT